MSKNIVIFSDGTGQVGGVSPDQNLSNVYKMYRAMRPGPASPISPQKQVCFYDPGIGSGSIGSISISSIRNVLASALGLGIDENVIDCYEKIISYYEPGDKIILIGFSRGAYTVRVVANVMNLCGVPTKMPDGTAVPRHGPRLRKIASDAVRYVYNYGSGKPRGEEPFYSNREELGRRFRQKYGSSVPGSDVDVQGNVQPHFIGVFDTVAALGNGQVGVVLWALASALVIAVFAMMFAGWPWLWWGAGLILILLVLFAYVKLKFSQWKYFSPSPERELRIRNPLDWWKIFKNGHYAKWNLKNYDRWLDSDVCFARHALAIDESRRNFPRVKWAMPAEEKKTEGRNPVWLKQVWFAGCHSDIGGSYPESESRLSDIALDWMLQELRDCVPGIFINDDMLYVFPDPLGMQHAEEYMFKFGPFMKKWPFQLRVVAEKIPVHPSVLERLEADSVSHLGEMKAYRPAQLSSHGACKKFYN